MKLSDAMVHCKARGYIARDAMPDIHHWKNTPWFNNLPLNLSQGSLIANDWHTYDPEGEETSVVG